MQILSLVPTLERGSKSLTLQHHEILVQNEGGILAAGAITPAFPRCIDCGKYHWIFRDEETGKRIIL